MGVAVLAAQSATFLILSPLVLRNLGPEAFGIWSLGSTILAFATLLDLGIGEAASQRVGELGGARAGSADVASIASEATRYYRRLSAIGFAAAPAVSVGLVAAVQFRTLPPLVVFGFFLCASAGFFVGLPSYARAAVLVGRGETWAQRIPLLVESVVTFVASLVALYSGLGLLALGAAILMSRASSALVRGWIYQRIVGPEPRPTRTLTAPGPSVSFISLRGAALPFLLIAIAARFEIAIGPLLLATRVGVDALGPYLFAFRCFFTLLQVTWQLTDQLFPAYRRLVVERGWSSASRLTERSLDVTLPFVAVSSCVGAFIYDRVVGSVAEGLVIGPVVTSLLALFAVVYHTVHVLAMGADGCGLQRRVMPVMVASAAAGFGLGIVLVEPLKSAGVIGGLILANVLAALPGLVRLWGTATSEASWRWVASAMAPALIAVATLIATHLAPEGAEPVIAIVASAVIVGNLVVFARGWPIFRSAVGDALAAVHQPSTSPLL